MNDRVKKAKQVFRADRFKLPAAALPEFAARRAPRTSGCVCFPASSKIGCQKARASTA